MKCKPYTNWTFEVIAVTPAPLKSRQIDRQGLYFSYILPKFDRSLRLHFADLDVDICRDRSYLYVE